MAENIVVESPDELAQMPDEYKQVLLHQMLAHTEGELMGVAEYLRISEIAPNAHEKMYCYEGARDEMLHYIVSAEVLDAIGVDTSYMLRPDAARTAYPHDWLSGKTTWAERGITSWLAEWGALEIIHEMAESSYRPWAAIMPRIIADETRHTEHGRRITEQALQTAEGREAVQRALDRMWPEVLDMFGRSDSERSRLAVKWGIRVRSNEEARQQFAARARAALRELDLQPPDDRLNRKFL
ncbi:MAG TPA: Phenylacetic acid catabolic protein [Candidatus Binatia bacterium]